MTFKSYFTYNGETKIHVIDSVDYADLQLTPIVICPGLSEIAEEYEELIQYLLPRRAIVLSFRGRGQSDTPEAGYDLYAHISDIEAVVQATQLDHFNLYGFSRGVSYALGYTRKHPHHIAKLCVIDYPCEHLAMSSDWPNEYIEHYLIPTKRIDYNIRRAAVMGIQKESKLENLAFEFTKPVLIIRGKRNGALLSDESLKIYLNYFHHAIVVDCEESGHDIRSNEQAKLFNAIKYFL